MKIDQPLTLLGGITPSQFMHEYWQRKPLVIRQAIPDFKHTLSIADIRKLVRRQEVESRLVWREANVWQTKAGPHSRLPAATQPGWTLLAQNVSLHDDATAALMHQFRFISDARLDDATISIATDGGGVGPHFDSADVFLLQAHGTCRWRISQQKGLSLEPGLPLNILANFQPDEEYVLEPGDLLYLPPHVAQDGVALGDSMTISIGCRAPTQATLACGLLEAANDQIMANLGAPKGMYSYPVIKGPELSATYKDRGIAATDAPASMPQPLIDATLAAINKVRFDSALASRFLGQWLTDLPENAYFAPGDDIPDITGGLPKTGRITLDRCTRMMYRERELFINGEVAPVGATKSLRQLADDRELPCHAPASRRLSEAELDTLLAWLDDGWAHYHED
ncbi:cupin domain-containing protein [Alcaligenaceae bacterium]|nr:cupin domain-containing protein [Alcaligenaceae bacterium]